jgi:hypothetical protein
MKDLVFSIKLSIALFTIETILLLLFAINLSPLIGMIGYIYTVLAFFVAFVYLILLLARVASGKIDRNLGVKSVVILMTNIPIAILYVYLVMVLLSYARITFENKTGHDTTSIKIGGCDEGEISKLAIDESQTIWLRIHGDCEIYIEYISNGQPYRETVCAYLTNNNGIAARYKIGSNKDIMSGF